MRYTLWSFFITVYTSCFKRFKAYLRPEKEEADDVFQEMSLKHLYQEYEKTINELAAIDSLRKNKSESIHKLQSRIERKLSHIRLTFRRLLTSRLTFIDEGDMGKWNDKEILAEIKELIK